MSLIIFLIENVLVSYLIALTSTDIYFVTLVYILQSICAGEHCGYSNYSKPYGHGKQLMNGIQFSRLKKNHLCCAWEKFGAWSWPLLILTEITAFYVDISWLAGKDEGPSIQAAALMSLIRFHKRLSSLPSASLMVRVLEASAPSNLTVLAGQAPITEYNLEWPDIQLLSKASLWRIVWRT